MNTFELIESIWVRTSNSPLNKSDLADRLINDAGLDIRDLTKDDLINLMEGKFDGLLSKDIATPFSELLAYYGGFELSTMQAVAWCFSALTLGEACRMCRTDWNSHLLVLSIDFVRVKQVLTYDEFVLILGRVLSPYSNGGEWMHPPRP